MTFTEKLDLLMEERHLNKSSLSKACGIPYTTIDGWYKKGYSDMKLSSLKKLTDYFGLSLDYWLKDDDEKEKSPAPEGTEDDKFSVDDMKYLLNFLGYGDNVDDLTEKDVAFLGGIFDLLDAWFG